MHILIIPSWYKTSETPFSGTFFEEQARMLLRAGHKVGILFPNHISSFKANFSPKKNSIDYYIDNELPTCISTTISILPTRFGYIINSYLIKKKANRAYALYCKEYGTPNILHAHSVLWGGIVAKYISKHTQIPYLITEHLSTLIDNNEFDNFPFNNLIKRAFLNSKKIIVVSSFSQDSMIKKYKLKNTCVISNVVNPIFFEFSKYPIKTNTTLKTIIICNFNKKKRVDVFIKTIALLRDNNIPIEAIIIGTGDEQKNYEILISKLDLFNNITIIPPQNRENIARYISKSHIVISTSEFETFGMTIAEAHAIGRPTVVYNAGGPKDIVDEKNGILLSELTPEAFYKAILNLWQNYDSYNQEKISMNCYNKFSEKIISQKINTIYNDIL